MEGIRRTVEGDGTKNTPNTEVWEASKETILYHYITRNLRLSEVMEEMEKVGFFATERMYKARLGVWKMGKNASRQDWLAFARIYQQRRAAGISETSIRIYNKIRRIQDLRKYLKSHGEGEEAFFAEAMASQVPTPQHVHCCKPDGSDAMILEGTEQLARTDVGIGEVDVSGPSWSYLPSMLPPSQQFNTFTQGEPSFVHHDGNLTDAGGSQAANSSSTSSRPHLLDGSFEQELGLVDSQVTTTTTEGEADYLTSIDNSIWPNQLGDPRDSATFVDMSDLSSFPRIADGDVGGLFHNAYGHELRLYDPPDEPQSASMSTPLVQPQPPGSTLSHNDAHTSYITACMLACMFGAARKRDSMNQCLLQASTAFRQMCVLQSPFILTAASTMLTWLLVHAERSLPERVMRTSFQVATEVWGCENPASVLLEWMTAAAAADKLRACLIDSARLQQLWQGFNQALGEEHGHTIVALYCLSFNLMFVDKNFSLAEQHLEYLCVVAARVFGPDDVQTINILATLSRAQHRQKKYPSALETINRSLVAAPLGLNHPHRLELLLRKALILRKLNNMEEMEELYWIVVKGRVATLGIHHRTTIAAHNSLVDVLHWNGTWETRKDDAHRLLVDPQVSVSEYENWWRRVVEGNRADQNQDRASSEEGE